VAHPGPCEPWGGNERDGSNDSGFFSGGTSRYRQTAISIAWPCSISMAAAGSPLPDSLRAGLQSSLKPSISKPRRATNPGGSIELEVELSSPACCLQPPGRRAHAHFELATDTGQGRQRIEVVDGTGDMPTRHRRKNHPTAGSAAARSGATGWRPGVWQPLAEQPPPGDCRRVCSVTAHGIGGAGPSGWRSPSPTPSNLPKPVYTIFWSGRHGPGAIHR